MSDARPVMLVTGASRGIGAAIARRAAADGYAVVVNYLASADVAEALAKELGNESFAVQADVGRGARDPGDVRDDRRALGQVDVLVNNAGIAGGYGDLDTYTSKLLERLWAVNLTGPFICAREATDRMRTGGGEAGSIVNISSKAARARRAGRVGALRGLQGRASTR